MRVFLTTAYRQGVALRFLREAAAMDRFGVHEMVTEPENADVVLFVENAEGDDPSYRRILAHPLVREFVNRAFMYNECDLPYCVLPGLYASMPARSFDDTRQVAFAYLFKPNEFVSQIPASGVQPDLLFSFMGAPNHRMRRRLLALKDSRARLEDTSSFSIWSTTNPSEITRRKRAYAELIAQSKFVLCPRGAGTSSYRLFEAMEGGRAPVVISDQWREAAGPDWSTFLVRLPESDVQNIPQILRGLEHEAAERGKIARAAWEQWYAPDVIFHRAIESIAGLANVKARRRSWRIWLHHAELLRKRTSRAMLSPIQRGRRFLRSIRGLGVR